MKIFICLGFFAMSLIAHGLANQACADDKVQLLRDRKPEQRPQMLILGVPHFAHRGADVINTEVPDVLEPQRQQQVEALVLALAKFRPTRIALEWSIAKQDELDERYRQYRAGTYQLQRDEIDQLGLRLAAMLNLPAVTAVNWNDMPPGVIADFDYAQWAQQHGAAAQLAEIRKPDASLRDTDYMRGTTVTQWLQRLNTPERLALSNRRYFDFAMLGDAANSPGANWVANWYGRNLKIFANLVRLANSPDERVLVIYGHGHAFLLRQFATQSGAFAVEDAETYLSTVKDPR